MKHLLKRIMVRFRLCLQNLKSDNGFSLLELLIVLVIIGILGTIVYTKFMDLPEKAKIEAAKQQILTFKMCLDRYKLDNDNYPTGDQGLEPIKQYLDSKYIPNDPWGTAYVYRSPGDNDEEYIIISMGKDKQEGTDDDIKSNELHKAGGKPKQVENK